MKIVKKSRLQVLWSRVQESEEEWHVIMESERLKAMKDEEKLG